MAWWGAPRRKGLPARAGPPSAIRRRKTPWPGVSTRQCSQESSGRPSVGQPTRRGEGVSFQRTNALKPGDRLQKSSGRSTRTCVSPPWKTPRVKLLRSKRTYPKRYLLTSRKMTSRGSHQSSLAQQVRWEQRRWSCATGSFALDVCPRSLESSPPAWLTGWLTPPPLGLLSRTDGMSPSGAR